MAMSAAKPVSLKKQSGDAATASAPPAAPAAQSGRPDGLALIMARNGFYTTQAQNLLTIVLGQLALLIMMAFVTVKMFDFTTSRDYYFPINNDNSMVLERPLRDPLFTDEQIIAWAEKAVNDTMTFGYYDHLMRLQDARNYFTLQGWEQFTKAIDDAGILATIGASESATISGVKQVISSSIRPDRKTVIEAQGNSGPVHYWKVKMSIDVNFQRLSQQTLMPWDVEVIILRMSANQSRHGIGIQSLLAKRGS